MKLNWNMEGVSLCLMPISLTRIFDGIHKSKAQHILLSGLCLDSDLPCWSHIQLPSFFFSGSYRLQARKRATSESYWGEQIGRPLSVLWMEQTFVSCFGWQEVREKLLDSKLCSCQQLCTISSDPVGSHQQLQAPLFVCLFVCFIILYGKLS